MEGLRRHGYSPYPNLHDSPSPVQILVAASRLSQFTHPENGKTRPFAIPKTDSPPEMRQDEALQASDCPGGVEFLDQAGAHHGAVQEGRDEFRNLFRIDRVE